MTRIILKRPLKTYQPRLSRFLRNMLAVKDMCPYDKHLWRVMDSVPFQDTETALEIALKNTQTQRKVS